MRKTFLMNCVLFACLLAASDCFADTRNAVYCVDLTNDYDVVDIE